MTDLSPIVLPLLFFAVLAGGLAVVSVWALARTRSEVPDSRDRRPLLVLFVVVVFVAVTCIWIITKIPEILSRAIY